MGKEDQRRAELTADHQKTKPVTLSRTESTLAQLLKEGKNKFRKKYKFVVYCASKDGGDDQHLRTDDDLRRVLALHDADSSPRLRLTDAPPPDDDAAATQRVEVDEGGGVVFVIGSEDDTEPDAVAQLRRAGRLPGCLYAVGMPDLHAGKGIPIGATIATEEGVAYPQLVDNDIGCGMSFVETSMKGGRMNTNKIKKMADRLRSIDCPYYDSAEEAIEACSGELRWGQRTVAPLEPLEESHHYEKLGTVGGGNHFAELQEFDEVIDPEACRRHGIDVDRVHMLVHSGSRSLGAQYLGQFCDEAAKTMKGGPYPAETDSELFQEYLRNHDAAVNFAVRNRRLIAIRLLEQLAPGEGAGEPTCKIDIVHNFLERAEIDSYDELKRMAEEQGLFPKTVPALNDGGKSVGGEKAVVGWVHRKGATPTTQSDILVIPGSRGSLSYLIEVNKSAHHGSAHSLAHGAGRKMARSTARAKHKARFPDPKKLLQTDLGGVVVCEEKDLVYEEAPGSYKDVDRVADCLANGVRAEGREGEGDGLVRVLATLRPVLTYKYKDPRARCC